MCRNYHVFLYLIIAGSYYVTCFPMRALYGEGERSVHLESSRLAAQPLSNGLTTMNLAKNAVAPYENDIEKGPRFPEFFFSPIILPLRQIATMSRNTTHFAEHFLKGTRRAQQFVNATWGNFSRHLFHYYIFPVANTTVNAVDTKTALIQVLVFSTITPCPQHGSIH